MDELIKIENKNGIPTCNARDLHEYLEVGAKFADWIKGRIEKYDFVDGLDFIKASEKKEASITGQTAIEYYVSIDMAKELSMVENNEKGKEARKYFIAVEKKAKELTALPKGQELIALALVEATKFLAEAERKNAILMHVSKTYTATEIAKEIGLRSAQELNEALESKGIQFKQNGTWVPKADYAQLGYFQIKQDVLDSGRVVYYTRITQDGRRFILDLLVDLFTKKIT